MNSRLIRTSDVDVPCARSKSEPWRSNSSLTYRRAPGNMRQIVWRLRLRSSRAQPLGVHVGQQTLVGRDLRLGTCQEPGVIVGFVELSQFQ